MYRPHYKSLISRNLLNSSKPERFILKKNKNVTDVWSPLCSVNNEHSRLNFSLENPYKGSANEFFKDFFYVNDRFNLLKKISHRLMLSYDFTSGFNPIFQCISFEAALYYCLQDLEEFKLSFQDLDGHDAEIEEIDNVIVIFLQLIFTLQQLYLFNIAFDSDLSFKKISIKEKKDRNSQRFRELSNYIYYQLFLMEPGEKILIPSGFLFKESNNNNSGHSALAKISCTLQNNYTVEFIDTDLDVKVVYDGKINDLVLLRMSNLSLQDIIKEKFIEDFLAPHLFISKDIHSAEVKYNKIFTKFIRSKNIQHGDDKLKRQTNFTCSHSSLEAFIKTELSEDLYNRFSNFVISKAILDCIDFINSSKSSNSTLLVDIEYLLISAEYECKSRNIDMPRLF